eukprot:11589423-Ditylum_brightwellii.AAC.1
MTHLSGIATSDGKSLHPVILSLQPDTLFNQIPTMNWAIQGNPEMPTWKIWQETIQSLYCSKRRTPNTPLGKWTLTHKVWTAYYFTSVHL